MKTGRVMLGATNPLESAPGTIRGDFAIDVRYIDIHCTYAISLCHIALPF